MTNVAELDLPHLALDEPEFGTNPLPRFAEARKKHPWLATTPLGLVITEHKAMRELFGRDDELRPPYKDVVSLLGQEGTVWGRFTEEQLISLPVDQHKFLRDTFAAKFTPRFANQMRPPVTGNRAPPDRPGAAAACRW